MSCFSQQKAYKYNIYVNDYSSPPEFVSINNNMVYSGSNNDLNNFLKDYTISSFYQMYPTSNRPINLRVFRLETFDSDMIDKMLQRFPSIFNGFVDVTDETYELSFYPNDYGSTNPNGNTGANINRNDLDYINVSKAWDITTGNITVGISDARINTSSEDFVNKVSFIYPHITQNQPYQNHSEYIHGTQTAGIAAARGNNGYGSTGVCYDCDIIGTSYYGGLNNVLLLAQAGVRVINMSWTGGFSNQDIIDEIVEDYGTVLVASAGNRSSYQTAIDGFCPTSHWDSVQNRFISNIIGEQILYPAAYDGVISVSGIGHLYSPFDTSNIESVSPLGFPIALHTRDSFSPNINVANPNNPIGLIYNGWAQNYCTQGINTGTVSTNGIVAHYTSNPNVDILAPGYDNFSFPRFVEEGQIFYYPAGGTSSAAPYVTGTAALMVSVNNCLTPREVENILKLTSKDVESMPINQLFVGKIGAGALNAGDAVEFVDEMKKVDGNALIKNHIFRRFDFSLQKINNNLSIQNLVFMDDCKVDFKVKNQIHILTETHFKPNSIGQIHLSVDASIDIACMSSFSEKKPNVKSIKKQKNKIALYPNPNNGFFNLYNLKLDDFEAIELNLQIFDLNGRSLFEKKLKRNDENECLINVENFSSGVYIVKLSSSSVTQEIKFIKN